MKGKRAVKSLVRKVLDGVVDDIVEGRYEITLPSQDILSRKFGVSRTVIREALSMLLARDMVEMRAKIGTRIRPITDWRMIDGDVVNWRLRAKPDPAFLRDVQELHAQVGPCAAVQAAARGSAEDIAAIRQAFERLRSLRPTGADFQVADKEFSASIVTASGNQLFKQMAPILRSTPPTLDADVVLDERVWEQTVNLHQRVVEAIERQDPKEAGEASRALIDYMAELF